MKIILFKLANQPFEIFFRNIPHMLATKRPQTEFYFKFFVWVCFVECFLYLEVPECEFDKAN